MIPEGWKVYNLEDLTVKISDGIHSTPKYAESSPIYFVNGNNLKNGRIVFQDSTKLVDEEDAIRHHRELGERTLLMSINGTIGNLAYYSGENIVLGKSACYLNINEKTDVDFIYYILSSSKTQAFFTSELTGSTIKNLSLKTIKLTKFPVPPLPEQRKIAKILSTWDKAIATTEKLIAASKQQKKALMQQLLTGKKRLVNPETGRVFEGEWEEVRLGDICHINPKKPSEPSNGLVSFVPMDAVSEEARLIRSEKRAYSEVFKGFTGFIDGDTLVAKITPCFENGKGAKVSCLENGVGFGSTEFHVLRPKNGVCSYFIYFQTVTSGFRIRGEMNMQGSAGQKRVTTDYLRVYKVVIPTELKEQQKIAQVLTTADQEIEHLTTKLAHFQQEKKAFMQQLFTGKRRVTVEEVARI